MDVSLISLIVMVAIVLGVSVRLHAKAVLGPGHDYQRVFSVAAIGTLFLVCGVIGLDLTQSHGWLQGTRWMDGPVWGEVASGSVLLLLAGVFASLIPARPAHR